MSEHPESPDEKQEAPLSMKKRENEVFHLGPTKPCPSCNGDTPEEAVICTRCGYNFETKKKLRTSTGKFKKIVVPLMSFIVIVLVVVVAVNLAKKATGKTKEVIDKSVSTIKEKTNEVSSGITEATKPYLEEAKEALEEVSEEIKVDLQKEGYLKPTEPEEDAPTSENLESEPQPAEGLEENLSADPIFDNLEAKLNKRLPMIRKKEFAKIKLANSKEISGTMVDSMVDFFMFENSKGEHVKIPYEKLHKISRLRLDPQFRKQYITQAAVKKRGEL